MKIKFPHCFIPLIILLYKCILSEFLYLSYRMRLRLHALYCHHKAYKLWVGSRTYAGSIRWPNAGSNTISACSSRIKHWPPTHAPKLGVGHHVDFQRSQTSLSVLTLVGMLAPTCWAGLMRNWSRIVTSSREEKDPFRSVTCDRTAFELTRILLLRENYTCLLIDGEAAS